jgi:O-methyltransferase involved in polyketide biosynthesis
LLQGLDAVERTLLIPLVARAWGHRWHLDASRPDTSAERVLSRLGWDDPSWMPDPVTLGLILWRTQRLCEWGQAHFARHPNAVGVNVGAGLSDYFQWLNTGTNRWLDADLACVTRVRQQCLPDQTHARSLALDVCEDDWWTTVQACIASKPQPMWIMLEGLLIYLTPAQVRRLLITLGEHAPTGSRLAFDVIPRWMVGCPIRVPQGSSLTGESRRGAEQVSGPCAVDSPPPAFQWGLDTVDELESVHQRLHVERIESSAVPWSGWSWLPHSGWNAWSPYALVQMSVG